MTPTMQTRVLWFLEQHDAVTIQQTADALGAPYQTIKAALNRAVRRGHATKARDPRDLRTMVFRFQARPATWQEIPDLPDDGWTPQPWVHPYRRVAA